MSYSSYCNSIATPAIELPQFWVFPVEAPDIVNQKQAVLTRLCPTPDPQNFEHSNMIVLQDQGVE